MAAKRRRTLRVGKITLKLTFPSNPGLFDVYREIGEEMGVPFIFEENKGNGPWAIDIFNEWALKIGIAFIQRHPAHNRRTGRLRGSVSLAPPQTKEAKKKRAKRARERQHDDEMQAKYLAWYKDRYGGT
jgi:hypothetical protein